MKFTSPINLSDSVAYAEEHNRVRRKKALKKWVTLSPCGKLIISGKIVP